MDRYKYTGLVYSTGSCIELPGVESPNLQLPFRNVVNHDGEFELSTDVLFNAYSVVTEEGERGEEGEDRDMLTNYDSLEIKCATPAGRPVKLLYTLEEVLTTRPGVVILTYFLKDVVVEDVARLVFRCEWKQVDHFGKDIDPVMEIPYKAILKVPYDESNDSLTVVMETVDLSRYYAYNFYSFIEGVQRARRMQRFRMLALLIGYFVVAQARAADRLYAPGGEGMEKAQLHFEETAAEQQSLG